MAVLRPRLRARLRRRLALGMFHGGYLQLGPFGRFASHRLDCVNHCRASHRPSGHVGVSCVEDKRREGGPVHSDESPELPGLPHPPPYHIRNRGGKSPAPNSEGTISGSGVGDITDDLQHVLRYRQMDRGPRREYEGLISGSDLRQQ